MIAVKERISVVLPAFNEGSVITETVERLISELEKYSDNYEIIIVNDGSTDDTKNKALKLKQIYPEIRLISYKTNKGKGNAIKRGLLSAGGDIDVIMDADLDIHPCQIHGYIIEYLKKHAKNEHIAGAIGCKLDKRSNVKFPLKRRIMSMGYYLFLKSMFHLDTKDTNTGLKVFDGNVIRSVAPKLFTKGYAYDIELLNYIYSDGYRVLSLPVNCTYTREPGIQRINFRQIKSMVRETMKIYMHSHE